MTIRIFDEAVEPPYEQLRRQIAALAADGTWPPGHRLGTVRATAEELGLAVNTVAKAYRALEADGVIETRGRAGTFIASKPVDTDLSTAADAYVAAARRSGIGLTQALRLVEDRWH